MWYWIVPAVLLGLLLLLFGGAALCYRIVFYSKPRTPLGDEEFRLPRGRVYEPYHEIMKTWIRRMRSEPYEALTLTARDGLTLRGRYYEVKKGAPVEILIHGYRGDPERDMSAAIERCYAVGHNALLVSQRGAGESEGHTLSFGILERHDCLDWVKLVIERFGPDVRIMLTGISMGAATVLMAAGEGLPPNVFAVLADCPFTSARDVIGGVMRKMKLPVPVFYPLVKLGARLFGRFDLDETSPLEAIGKITVPVILYHGEVDFLVPCDHSRRLAAAAASHARLVTVPGADHALAYGLNPEGYVTALRAFLDEHGPKDAE
ncbi:MAG: prolyl oligopeptidase family serine peptidase [Clostridia bacterium]|nr:prolyl oligopeptidase family serine peptidase [Clostridia bacterium]